MESTTHTTSDLNAKCSYILSDHSKQLCPSAIRNLVFFFFLQHLMVTTHRFTVIIEEKLLLKLLTFFGYGKTEAGRTKIYCTATC